MQVTQNTEHPFQILLEIQISETKQNGDPVWQTNVEKI